ncbi:MAG: hypothetical protein AAFP03_13680 [Cyanobacteria bacterium J06598_3]
MKDTLLSARRHSPQAVCNPLTKLHIPPVTIGIPTNFPNVEPPQFAYGDRLRWKTHTTTTDSGIVTGRFYSFTPHRRRWQWSYLIWLDSASPSAAWTRADIAWEEDLERHKPKPYKPEA